MTSPYHSINSRWWHDYKWQLIIVMTLGAVANYIDRVNLSFAAVNIRQEFNLTTNQMGFILAAWMWPYAIANLPSGWLIDKLGINKIFIWSVVLWSISTVVSGLTTTYHELYVSRICLGITEAPFFVIGGKIVRLYFHENSRGIAASIFNTGPKIANGFAPPLITALIIFTSWRGMFLILGAFGLIIVMLWIRIYSKAKKNFTTDNQIQNNNLNLKFSFWKLFKHKTSWWFYLGNFGSSYVFWLYFTWLPTYLIDNRGLDLKTAGWVTALPFIGGIIAVPFGGYISDLLIRRYNFSIIKARLIPAVMGCLIAGITVIPINYIDNLNIAIILFTISTFSVSARAGVLWALVSDITPKNAVGTLGGIQNCANFIGGALAPTITGVILQQTNNYNIVFGLSGILIILAALCYSMISKPITSTEIT